MAGKLKIGTGPDRCCDLDSHPVDVDETLEVLLEDKSWLRGRFRWSGEPSDPPRLAVALSGEDSEALLVLPAGALLRRARKGSGMRWPGKDDNPSVCGSGGND